MYLPIKVLKALSVYKLYPFSFPCGFNFINYNYQPYTWLIVCPKQSIKLEKLTQTVLDLVLYKEFPGVLPHLNWNLFIIFSSPLKNIYLFQIQKGI